MSERGPGISEDQLQGIINHKNPPTISLSVEQNSNSLSPWSTSKEATVPSNNSLALTRTRGATTSSSQLQEFQQVKCYCDGRPHLSESGSVARQPFCGWEERILPSTGSTHIIFTHNSDQSLGSNGYSHRETNRSANGAFTKSKCSVYQSTNHKRTDFRSQVRSYVYSSDSKAILYEFEHHSRGSDTSLYIDKYRKSITYPKMEQKSLPLTSGMAGYSGGELSLLSLGSRCVPSSVLKPKLFILGEGSSASHARPLTCRKSYTHGAGFYSTPESKPKFRLSDLNSTLVQQQKQHSSSSDERSKMEAKQYPVPVITGFSSMPNELTQNQSSEIEFVGAEEDSDAHLSSMTWVSTQSVPESYLVSSVMYQAPSTTRPSIPKQRTMSSTLSKNPSAVCSAGFRGSMYVNPFRSLNRGLGSGATLLAMAGKKSQTFSRNGATKKLTYGFQLSSHSMPLIKSGEKASTKTNRLGHLLRRKHRTDTTNFRSTSSGEADNMVSVHGVY